MDSKPDNAPAHFIRHIIDADNASGKHGGRAERLQACGCRVGQHVLHRNLQVDGGLQGLLGMGGFGYAGAAVL